MQPPNWFDLPSKMVLIVLALGIAASIWLLRRRARVCANLLATHAELSTVGVQTWARVLSYSLDPNLFINYMLDVVPPGAPKAPPYRVMLRSDSIKIERAFGWVQLLVDPRDYSRVAWMKPVGEAWLAFYCGASALLCGAFLLIPLLFLNEFNVAAGTFGPLWLGQLLLWTVAAGFLFSLLWLTIRRLPPDPSSSAFSRRWLLGMCVFSTLPIIGWADELNRWIPIGRPRELDAEVTKLERPRRARWTPWMVRSALGEGEFHAARFAGSNVSYRGPVRIRVRRGILGCDAIVSMWDR